MINMTADEIIAANRKSHDFVSALLEAHGFPRREYNPNRLYYICGITSVEWLWALYNHVARKQSAHEISVSDAEKILGEEGVRQQVGLWNGTVPMGRIKIDKVRGIELGIVLDPEGVDCTEYNRLYDNAAVIVAAERRQERAAVMAQDAVRNATLYTGTEL